MTERHPPAKHAPHPKEPKGPNGPKERELAVALTVAALGAARIDEPLEIVAKKTLDVFDLMLAAVVRRASEQHGKHRE